MHQLRAYVLALAFGVMALAMPMAVPKASAFSGPDGGGYMLFEGGEPFGPGTFSSIEGQAGTNTYYPYEYDYDAWYCSNDSAWCYGYSYSYGAQTNVAIGFPFTFYGGSFTNVLLSGHGYMKFGSSVSNYYDNNVWYSYVCSDAYQTSYVMEAPCGPMGSANNGIGNAIAPLFADWNLDCGERILYQQSGTAPNKVFTVEWTGMQQSQGQYNCSGPPMRFQVKLFQAKSCIEIYYDKVDSPVFNDKAAAAGVEKTTGQGTSLGYWPAYTSFDMTGKTYKVCKVLPPDTDPDNVALPLYEDYLPVDIDVLANDNDPEGTGLQDLTVVTQGSKGVATVMGTAPNQYIHYQQSPNANTAYGPSQVTFKYTVANGYGVVSAATSVTVTLKPVNDPPIVTVAGGSVPASLEDGGAVSLPGLVTISPGPTPDEAPQQVTFSVSSDNADLFEVQPSVVGGTLSYKAKPHANGEAKVTIVAKDNGGTAKGGDDTSDPYVLDIKVKPVNDAPSFTMPDTVSAPEDGPAVSLPGFATDLKRGPDGAADEAAQALAFTVALPPGAAANFQSAPAIDPTGRLTFHLKPNACVDGLVATVTMKDDGGVADGGIDSATDSFTFLSKCLNDAPVANDDDYTDAAGLKGSSMVLPVLQNDVHAEGKDTLWLVSDDPAHGTAVLDWVLDGGLTVPAIQYTPDPGFTGEEVFSYVISDGLLQDGAIVRVAVECAGFDALADGSGSPFSLVEDSAEVAFGAPLTANDELGAQALYPGSSLKIGLATKPQKGTATVLSDGTFTYTPDPQMFGADSFAYQVDLIDASGKTVCSTKAPVQMQLLGTNDPPSAKPDTFTAVVGEQGKVLDVLQNDGVLPDAGETLTVVSVTQPATGAVALVGGKLVYDAKPGFVGTDTFTYTVGDGSGLTATTAVQVVTAPFNQRPEAKPDEYLARPGGPTTYDVGRGVLRNDADPEGANLTAVLMGTPEHGQIDMAPDGSFAYTPVPGFLGNDRFTYVASDGLGVSLPAEVHVRVAANLPPVAGFAIPAETMLAGSQVRLEDLSFDPDGAIEAWWWTFGDGAISAEPSPSHAFAAPGEYTIELRVRDNEGLTASATQTLLVVQEFASELGGSYEGGAPHAEAGPVVEAMPGESVLLRGARAQGEPDTIVSSHWAQTAGPEVELIGADTRELTFTAPPIPEGAEYVMLEFAFRVFDGHLESAPDHTQVFVQKAKAAGPPRAQAGEDQVADALADVTLQGGSAGFPAGASMSYAWTQLRGASVGPLGSGAKAEFAAPLPDGDALVFELTATDGTTTVTDTVTVLVREPDQPVTAASLGQGKYRFTAAVGGPYTWTFDDGQTVVGDAPVRTFEPGLHRVQVQVPWGDGTRTFGGEVLVVQAPEREANRDAAAAGALLSVLVVAAAALSRRLRA